MSHPVLIICLALATLSAQALAHGKPECGLKNICFVLDRSLSMRSSYDKVQDFTTKVADILSLRTATVEYSAVGFSNSYVPIVGPTTNVNDFKTAVNVHVIPNGGTNMNVGVKACYDRLVSGTTGTRVMVLVTDGMDNGSPKAMDFKATAEAAMIGIVTVGIGSRVDESYLKDFATEPQFYLPSAVGTLPEKALNVADKICEVISIEKPCQKAYDECKLKFHTRDSIPTYSMDSKPNRVFSNHIVSRTGMKVGVLNTNNITPEFIAEDGSAFPITDFGSQKFTPTHFKPFSMPKSHRKSGIGHQTFQGDQKQIARGKCVRVFFSSFQVLSKGPKPRVITNMNVSKADKYCVVFKTE